MQMLGSARMLQGCVEKLRKNSPQNQSVQVHYVDTLAAMKRMVLAHKLEPALGDDDAA
jgi:hypothetical protein